MLNSSIKKGTKAYQLIVDEKGFGGDLSTLGKLAYFKEVFENEGLQDEFINNILPLDNVKEQKSFKSGYEMAIALVKNGFSEEDYIEFLKNIRKQLQSKINLAEKIRKSR